MRNRKKLIHSFAKTRKFAFLFVMLAMLGAGEMWGGTFTSDGDTYFYLNKTQYPKDKDATLDFSADGAVIHVYMWGGTAEGQWYEASNISGDVWGVEVTTSGTYTKFLIRRKDPNHADAHNTGNDYGEWNRTGDLDFDDTHNYKLSSSWSNYGAPSICGSFNSWNAAPNQLSGSATSMTCSISLSANSSYRFKVLEGSSWYGYGKDDSGDENKTYHTFIGQSGTVSLSTGTANLYLLTAGAGTYVFTYNQSLHTLSVAFPEVTHPTEDYTYFKNTDSWSPVTGHVWGGTYGTAASNYPELPTFNFDGTNYYFIARGDNTSGLFANGIKTPGSKTSDLSDIATTGKGKGKYLDKGTSPYWFDFKALISFDQQGGTNGDASVNPVYQTDVLANIKVPSDKSGYSFQGYYTSAGGGGDMIVNSTGEWQTVSGYTDASAHWIKPAATASATIYAKWTQSVNLDNTGCDTNGSENVTLTYNSSSHAALTYPSKTGYTFKGWTTGSGGSGSVVIDENGALQSSVSVNTTNYTDASGKWIYNGNAPTLYAKWNPKTYTINFNFNGGAGATVPKSIIATYNSSSLTSPSPASTAITNAPWKTGYKFMGWYSGVGGTGNLIINSSGELVSGTDYTDESGNWTYTDGVTLYAKWDYRWAIAGNWDSYEEHLLTGVNTISSKTYGSAVLILDANSHYTFRVINRGYKAGDGSSNYRLSAAGSIEYDGDKTKKVASGGFYTYDIDLYTAGAGSYTFGYNITDDEVTVTYPTSYTVTYGWTAGMPSPGTGVTASVGGNALASGGYVTEGSDVTFTETHPTGFTLTGWYTTQDGDDEVSGMSTSDNVLDNIGANATVYAKYTENHFDVTAAASPATGGIVTPASATSFGQYYGGDISATPYIGYSFTGWTGGTGDYVNESLASTKFKPTATSTVTAGFTRCYAFIEGRLRVRTSDRSSTITVGTAGGAGDYNSRSIPMTYDETNHRFYCQTYSTPDELKEISSGDDAYFLIQTSTSSSSWVDMKKYGAIASSDGGINALSASGTPLTTILNNRTFKFTGSENAYVIIYFDGTNVWYELEPTFTGTVSGHETEWSNTGNWTTGELPTINEVVYINKPVVVDIEHAAAKGVILNRDSPNTGKLTIQANKGLEVLQTVQVYDGSSYGPTTAADLVLESSSSGNASLVFNNSNSCAATVQMYSPATISTNWNWQFMGTPFTSANALYSYYGAYLYEWQSTGTWDAVANGGTMTPFTGYCITQNAPTTYVMDGTLNPNSDVEINIPASKEFVMANSWSAPIFVSGFTNTTLPLTDQNIYLFNTGHASDPEDPADEGTGPGTYIAMPINSAKYTGNDLIAPMEGFYVDNRSGSAATITLKYDELVRPSGSHTDIVAGAMHAPKRADNEPAVMKIKATGSRYSERIVILAREDFSSGFDNGWDGKNLNEPGVAPILYALRADGTKDAVSAIPNYEGTVVGFRKGEDSQYTFSFDYDGAEMLYLNDLKQQTSTLIDAEHSYTFTTAADDAEARFIISASPIAKTPTGIEGTEYRGRNTEVRKLMIDGVLYIIRGGHMYNAIGLMIK